MPEPLIELRSVSRIYGEGGTQVTALDNVSLAIHRGAFTAIMGPSGSGKSTLMTIAAGLDDPTTGEVSFDGRRMDQLDDAARTALRRTEIGFIFQSFNLVPTLTAYENVVLPFELAARTITGDTRSWIEHLVGTLGLSKRLNHRPHELSGGQQQRVAIARALAARPTIIFADEPTGNLDSQSAREVLTLLRTASLDEGQTIAMVSHSAVASSYADRVVTIADGSVAGDYGRMSAQQISTIVLELDGVNS